ncbi:MAG: DUF3649 domain-containing protein [Pseudomonadota bacterium]|nr:DUF3649 domain-containing protein [Pseudomonadota bacterium]
MLGGNTNSAERGSGDKTARAPGPMSQLTLRYRSSIAARALAAVVGGYMLTTRSVALLAIHLPITPFEATLTATMLSFAIYAGVVLWVFATRHAWRAWLGMAVALAILQALQRPSDSAVLL